MLSRSIYIPLTLLFGLVGCQPIQQPNTADTDLPTQVGADTGPDVATQALIDQGQRYGQWVGNINPYIDQNQYQTYTANWPAFVDSTEFSYPDVYAHYSSGCPGTADTVVIDSLLNDAMPVANAYQLEQYQAQAAGGTPPPWISNNSYWWGRQSCFGTTDAPWMIGVMSDSTKAATTLATLVGAPGWVVNLYLKAMISSANSCYANKAYFCISYSYTGVMWISC